MKKVGLNPYFLNKSPKCLTEQKGDTLENEKLKTGDHTQTPKGRALIIFSKKPLLPKKKQEGQVIMETRKKSLSHKPISPALKGTNLPKKPLLSRDRGDPKKWQVVGG